MAALSADDYDSLKETLAILNDADAVAAIRAGVADVEAGRTQSAEEVLMAMIEAGRLTE